MHTVLSISVVVYIVNAQWESGSTMIPRGDKQMAVGSYNDSIFILGGDLNPNQLLEFNDGCFIDHGDNALPVEVSGGAQFYTHVDDVLYMINTAGSRVNIYNMKTKSFTSSWATIPVQVGTNGISRGCLASDSNQLYVVGGEGYNEANPNDPQLQTVQVLSLSTKQWFDAPLTQVSRSEGCCVADESALYVLGGYGSGQPVYDPLNIEKIPTSNIQQQSWSDLSGELPYSIYGQRCVFHNNLIHMIGGIMYWNAPADNDHANTVTIIDPSTGSVSQSSDLFPFNIAYVAALTVNDIIYSFGGQESYSLNINYWVQYSSIVPLPTYPAICPTKAPTKAPSTTKAPTGAPTASSISPTQFPTTRAPTKFPTNSPTKVPTNTPSQVPTLSPTKFPTKSPTKATTEVPTKSPTRAPTNVPTESPTKTPTEMPSIAPTLSPTKTPTFPPTMSPSLPTGVPTAVPSRVPSRVPTITISTTLDDASDKEESGQNQNAAQNQWISPLVVIIGTLLVPVIIFCIYRCKQKQNRKMTTDPMTDLPPIPEQNDAGDNCKPLAEWSVDDVYNWLSVVEDGSLKELAEAFKKESVRGRALAVITEEILTETFGLALGDMLLFKSVRQDLLVEHEPNYIYPALPAEDNDPDQANVEVAAENVGDVTAEGPLTQEGAITTEGPTDTGDNDLATVMYNKTSTIFKPSHSTAIFK